MAAPGVRRRPVSLVLSLLATFVLASACGDQHVASNAVAAAASTAVDHGTYLAYVPPGLSAGSKVPLVLALSPSADAAAMVRAWAPAADRLGWIVVASKEFRNGIDWDVCIPQVDAELTSAATRYPIDRSRIVLTGFSGGAMASLGYAAFHPDRVRAVVANTGISEPSLPVAMPRDKLAVFLASVGDFRYDEMKRDRLRLDAQGWTTTWIEFDGGHRLAPPDKNREAAEWLAARF